MRIENAQDAPHHVPMDEYTANALFDQAVDLAYQAFGEPNDDHIETIYHRLVLNHQWGLGDVGAVTVH